MSKENGEYAALLKEKLIFSLDALSEIGEELSSAEQFQESSKAILHLIMGTLVISKAAILLYDSRREELEVVASRGVKKPGLRIKLPESARRKLHTGPVTNYINAPKEEALSRFFDEHRDDLELLHSYIWVPLRVKSRLLGVISISKKFMDNEYEQVDLELLHIISQQLSIAINNYCLIRDLKDSNFQLNRKILELETLYDLGIAIGSLMAIPELAEQILINAVGLTDASAGLLALKGENGLELGAGINLPSDNLESLESYKSLAKVLERNESILDNSNESTDKPFGFNKLLLVPLRGQRQVLGLIGLADKESREGLKDFSEEDMRLLLNFATQAGIAIENAKFYAESLEKEKLERELHVAASIQKNLLPDAPPNIPGMQIAATTIPSRFVGGDFYDFMEREGLHLFSIADVSGKGIPAALLVSTLHATLHALTEDAWDITRILERISQSIYKSSLSNKFITFFLAQYDPDTSILTSINAGHNYPLLVTADGNIKHLRSGGLCLGMLPKSRYEKESNQMMPGDLLVMYTDGVTEAFNHDEEEFGEERLEELLINNRRHSAQEILDAILNAVSNFVDGAPQYDDITLAVFKMAEESRP